MKPRLTIVPLGGLCNRIRVVLSAIHLAPTLPIPIVIEWGKDKDCFASFEDLFLPVTGENYSFCNRTWYNHHNTRYNLKLPGLLRRFLYHRQHDSFHPHYHGTLHDFVDKHRRVYISTGFALGDYPLDMVNLLRPRPELAEEIDKLVSQFSSTTIGVHIRRTDHKEAIAYSSNEAFIRAMQREIEIDTSVKFYLATDDEDLKSALVKRFAGRIITQRTNCRRDTLQGIKEAVIDLYTLAETKKILGSFYSSFSGTASEFKNIPLEVVE